MRRSLSPLLLLAACSGGSHPTTTLPGSGSDTGSDTGSATGSASGSGSDTTTVNSTPLDTAALTQAGVRPDWMDGTADPCSDFYQYACGTMLKQDIPADLPEWGAFMSDIRASEDYGHDLLEKAKSDPGKDPDMKKLGAFYGSCMDEDAIEKKGATPLDPYMKMIATVKDAKSAQNVIIKLHAAGMFPFFSTSPEQDFVDATKMIISLDQSGLGLYDKKFYLNDDGNLKAVRAAYADHVGKMFTLLGGQDADAASDAIAVETELAKAQQDEDARNDPHNLYHPVDRKGLAKLAPKFPWKAYFKALGLDKDNAISVNEPTYYTAIDNILETEKPAAIRHYLAWRVLDHNASLLSKAFVDEEFAFSKNLTGQQQLPDRWRRCYNHIDGALGQLIGKKFVADKFGGDAKDQATALVKSIIAAFDADLDTLSWMDDATRTAAHAKLGKMAYLVGYPDKWRDYKYTVKKDDYFGNSIAYRAWEQKRQLAKIGKPVDRTDWDINPQTVNAYYNPSLNELVLPAAMLQPPFFKVGALPEVNYGGTGYVVGHEMTHGFDAGGAEFDGAGNMKDWWSKDTRTQWTAKTQCVIDQYSQYPATPDVKVDGKLTINENIADIGGVKNSHNAYRASVSGDQAPVGGMSDDQLFYIAAGQAWCEVMRPEFADTLAHLDQHSPGKWRVNGTMVDQPGFAQAFSCKSGTQMAPANTCSVW